MVDRWIQRHSQLSALIFNGSSALLPFNLVRPSARPSLLFLVVVLLSELRLCGAGMHVGFRPYWTHRDSLDDKDPN